MAKIKLKIKDPAKSPSVETRNNIMKLIGDNNISISRLAEVRDGYVVFTVDNSENKLLDSKIINKIKQIGLEVPLPPATVARYTLVLKKLDWGFFQNNIDQIKTEIEDAAPYTSNKIEEIYLMEKHSIAKIKFIDLAVAEKLKREGTKLFHCIISPTQIENEKFMEVKQCFKCYGYGHFKADCNVTTPVCSECSSKDHIWTQCNARENEKKCPQCGENHRSFSKQCRVRQAAAKQFKEEKEKKEEEVATQQYANVIEKSTANAVQASQKTFSDMVKSSVNNNILQRSARTAVQATQDILITKIEEIIDRKISGMEKRLREMLQRALTEGAIGGREESMDEGGRSSDNRSRNTMVKITPKNIATDTDEEGGFKRPSKTTTRKRRIVRRDTPQKPNEGRFSILADRPENFELVSSDSESIISVDRGQQPKHKARKKTSPAKEDGKVKVIVTAPPRESSTERNSKGARPKTTVCKTKENKEQNQKERDSETEQILRIIDDVISDEYEPNDQPEPKDSDIDAISPFNLSQALSPLIPVPEMTPTDVTTLLQEVQLLRQEKERKEAEEKEKEDEHKRRLDEEEKTALQIETENAYKREHKELIQEENRRKTELKLQEEIKRKAETEEEKLRTYFSMETLITNDLETLKAYIRKYEEDVISNEIREMASQEKLRKSPELYDQEAIKQRLAIIERYKRSLNEAIKRLKEAVRRKIRHKELSSLPW